MKQAPKLRFKPLWMIHNSTYRQLVRGSLRKRLKRYAAKALRILRIKR